MTSKIVECIWITIGVLVLLYILGRAVIRTEQEIFDAINYCYDYYNILGPTRDELLDCIAKIRR